MDLKLNLDEFENILIYKSLTDERYLSAIVPYIKPAYFRDKNIKGIFETISAFYTKHLSVPSITELKSYITNDEIKESFKTVIRSFANIDKNLNGDFVMECTERYIKERAIYTTLLEVAEDISNNKVDTGFILDKFEKSCNFNLSQDMGLNLYKDFNRVLEDIMADKPTIPSGWKWLDEKLDGGFLANGRALYVFAGETNVGKSIVLGNIATNIAKQGKCVLLITLEMSEMMYAKRLTSNATQVPMKELKFDPNTLKRQIEEIHQGNPNGCIIIKEFPPSTVTPANLQSFIKTLTASGIQIHAIVLDYLNLLKGSAGVNSYEKVKEIAEQVRAMSYIFKGPVISATQLNRTGYNQINPGVESTSESIGLPATADVMVSIFQDDEDRELSIIKFGMMKNRFGANNGVASFSLDYNTLTITESEGLNGTASDLSVTGTLASLSD